MPNGYRTVAKGQWPSTRDEALMMTEKLLQQMWAQGCTCKEGCKVEFMEPPLGENYIQVSHHPLCPMTRNN
jgi:hypothetical protein